MSDRALIEILGRTQAGVLDSSGNIYVAGGLNHLDFPVVNAFQSYVILVPVLRFAIWVSRILVPVLRFAIWVSRILVPVLQFAIRFLSRCRSCNLQFGFCRGAGPAICNSASVVVPVPRFAIWLPQTRADK
jgi:hypothetical protein